MSEEPKDKPKGTDWGKLIKEGAVVGTVFAIVAVGIKGLIGRARNDEA